MKNLVVFAGIFLPALVSYAAPEDRAIVLSGGLDPFENRNSLYLQTQMILETLHGRMSPGQIDLFFGAGNSPSTRNLIPDVHRFSTRSRLDFVDELVPGILPDNRAADSPTLEEYFHSELPNKMNPKGNLFFLVSDHGMPNPFLRENEASYSNNCIVLWNGMPGADAQPRNPCLSVTDLKSRLELANAKRTVFAMTQCYSGGFHGMSVRRDEENHWTANPKVCGFTATTEDEVSNGCSMEVDSLKYIGYERRITEALTGFDMATGAALAPAARSLLSAHRRAAEIDTNYDIPLTTSDVFLRNWAQDIETRGFKPRAGRGAKARRDFIEVAEGRISHEKILASSKWLRAWFEAKFNHLARMAATVGETSETVKRLWDQPLSLLRKSIDEMNSEIASKQKELATIQEQIDVLNQGTLHPAYLDHLNARALEPTFLQNPANMYHYQIALTPDLYQSQMYILSKAQSPLALILAEQMRSYGEVSRDILLGLRNGTYRDEVGLRDELYKKEESVQADIWELQRERNLLRRFQIQREALAAAHAIVRMNDKKALSDLQGLLECEATPF